MMHDASERYSIVPYHTKMILWQIDTTTYDTQDSITILDLPIERVLLIFYVSGTSIIIILLPVQQKEHNKKWRPTPSNIVTTSHSFHTPSSTALLYPQDLSFLFMSLYRHPFGASHAIISSTSSGVQGLFWE